MWRSSRLWRGAGPEGSASKKLAYRQELVRKHNEKAQAQALHIWLYQLICGKVGLALCVMRKHPKLGEELLNSPGNVAPTMRVKILRPRYVVDL